MQRLLGACIFAGLLNLFGESAAGTNPLIELRFNENTNEVLSTGSERLEGQMLDKSGEARNLHSTDAAGVSGQERDRAFDNSQSTMGADGGITIVPSYSTFPPLASALTITGWLKPTGLFGDPELARLVRVVGSDSGFDMGYTKNGQLTLRLNGLDRATSQPTIDPVPRESGDWVFFAVVFLRRQILFYSGTPLSEVKLINAAEIDETQIVLNGKQAEVGNSMTRNRAFAGYLDNIRVFASEGSEGALDLEALEMIRLSDVANQPAR